MLVIYLQSGVVPDCVCQLTLEEHAAIGGTRWQEPEPPGRPQRPQVCALPAASAACRGGTDRAVRGQTRAAEPHGGALLVTPSAGW
jgi:hypothetical protein